MGPGPLSPQVVDRQPIIPGRLHNPVHPCVKLALGRVSLPLLGLAHRLGDWDVPGRQVPVGVLDQERQHRLGRSRIPPLEGVLHRRVPVGRRYLGVIDDPDPLDDRRVCQAQGGILFAAQITRAVGLIEVCRPWIARNGPVSPLSSP